jgi:hypothetical protein
MGWRGIVPRIVGIVSGLVGVVIWAAATPAQAQSNIDAGKSAAQIFASTCNACHRSPREIKRTTPAFMREHYTTGMQEANTMAAYLATVGTDPRAVEQRKKPVIGAGREPPPEARNGNDQAKSGDAQAALDTTAGAKGPQTGRSRRPNESLEIDGALAAASPAEQHAAAPPPAPVPQASFEE